MEESLQTFEKNIKKKHSFGWTPKYEEEFKTSLNDKVFIPIAEKTIEKLNWDLVHIENKTIESKRKETSYGVEKWTESIIIEYKNGKINVKSESLGNEIWDYGKNSKRVRLFIHAFKEIEKGFDKESLEKLEIEVERKNNWDDYVIPENLPKPNNVKKPNFLVTVICGFVLSIILSLILAKVSVSFYIIFLFEYLVAFTIGYCLKYFIKISNFTEIPKLKYLLIGMIFLIFFLNQYFQYEIILSEKNFERIGFYEFIKLRLEQGLTIKDLNTGWIGFIFVWVLQIVITYYIGLLSLISGVISYQLERVPIEVVDFAFYHFVKEKTEKQVREELKNKGWTEKQNQDEVFEAIEAIYGAKQINRMK